MIAVDTNVLLRYVLDDDARQAQAARRLIDEQCSPENPAFVHEVVMAELVWVLHQRGNEARSQIARTLRDILDNAHLAFRDFDALAAAADAFEEGPADFADYLIAAAALAVGAETTYTFDRAAARSPVYTLLEG